MLPLLARTGRHRQRYEDQLRLVAGCIPYRLKEDVDDHSCDLVNGLEVLMISSPNRDDLVFPKGGWEDDESVWQAACREALEEAGVRGILDENQLGVWEFRSKSRQDSSSLEGGCRGYMFALRVTEELNSWPEQASHDRKWLTVGEAFKLCRYEWMRGALDQFLRVLSKKMEQRERKILMEPPSVPVTEHRIVPPNCFVTPCGSQPLDETYDCVVAGLVDPSSVPVPEHPVLPPNCYVKKPPGSPHLDEPHDCVVQG